MSTQLFPSMTPDVMATLMRAARRRRAERRGAWRCALNNLSSGVESRHAAHIIAFKCTELNAEASEAGVAPGLLNTFRPAILAKEDAALCAVSTSSIHAHVEREGGANSASASADSVRGNATA